MPPKNSTVDLKRKYQRMFEVGIIVSIVFVILAFRFFPEPAGEEILELTPEEDITVVDIPLSGVPPVPPPPPKPPVPVEAPSDEDLPDIPINDTEFDPSEKIEITTVTLNDDKDESLDDVIFLVVEDMPSPIGGIGEIQRKVIYPEIAVRAGVQGKVFVKAIVKQDGNLDSVHVVQGIGAGCDKAAIKAVQNSKFKPGTQRGKPVNVWISIPVKFKLN